MPMHVGDNHDRGGNDTQVQFFDRGTNMHRLWDGGMLEHVSTDEDYWLKELTVLPSAQSRDAATAGTVEDWATESLLAAREAYVDPATGQRIKPGAKLGLDYHNKNIPVVKERMYLAGIAAGESVERVFSLKMPRNSHWSTVIGHWSFVNLFSCFGQTMLLTIRSLPRVTL